MKPRVEEGAEWDQVQRRKVGLELGTVVEQEERRSRIELVYGAHPRWERAEWGQETWGQKRMEGLKQEPGSWVVQLGSKRREQKITEQ